MRQIGVVILGASTYDYWHSLDDPRFAASAKAFRRLFTHAGTLGGNVHEQAQILDLYDSPASADDITSQIVEFVAQSDFDDVIIYYCGHGFISADRKGYCVTLRRTKELTKTSSSLLVRNLAHDLDEHLIGKRTFIVFDSCFSGDAVKEFMAPGFLDNFVDDYLMESFPRSGTAVIYATSGGDVALSKQQDTMTLFTGTLVNVLGAGLEARRDAALISWRDAVEQVRKLTKERLGIAAPRPSITAVKSDDGDITTMPFFANSAHARAMGEATLSPATFSPATLSPPTVSQPTFGAPAASPVPVGSAPVSPAPVLALPAPAPRRRVGLMAGIAAAVVAVVGGGVGGFYVIDQRHSQRLTDLKLDMDVRDSSAARPAQAAVATPSVAVAPVASVVAPAVDTAATQAAAKAAQEAAASAAAAEAERQRLAAEQRAQEEQLAALRRQQIEAETARLKAAEAENARRQAQLEAQAEAERVRIARISEAERCDQLAANPNDRAKPDTVAGVYPQTLQLQAKDALAACGRAVGYFPAEPRFKYQLARALQADDPRGALALQAELVSLSYPAAFDPFGWLTVQLQKNYPAAVDAFRKGAQLGDPTAMVSLARMIEEKRFTPATPAEGRTELYRRAAALGYPGAASSYQAALKEEQAAQERLAQEKAAQEKAAAQRAAAQQRPVSQSQPRPQPQPVQQQPAQRQPTAQEQAANAAAMGAVMGIVGGGIGGLINRR
ncbi:hypothetical protein GCM10007301_38410 [Azorhizobium oxalatiphilum]|uniref:Peptidase C14 caspase domain-containing protein n=1 Tax=Azorhizobium oxalatiphilum TaxID=980631 RepID=A0A917FGB6_9HYPH|nr:caspase family protein [Azorhizobium oxalatiphilum]GGF74848.1 hypothetical protein GCM10007301_38410 [Azorhizobium oxalatiphilum]